MALVVEHINRSLPKMLRTVRSRMGGGHPSKRLIPQFLSDPDLVALALKRGQERPAASAMAAMAGMGIFDWSVRERADMAAKLAKTYGDHAVQVLLLAAGSAWLSGADNPGAVVARHRLPNALTGQGTVVDHGHPQSVGKLLESFCDVVVEPDPEVARMAVSEPGCSRRLVDEDYNRYMDEAIEAMIETYVLAIKADREKHTKRLAHGPGEGYVASHGRPPDLLL